MNTQHNQAPQPERREKAFSVFWPETKEGRQIWLFILGFMAFAGGFVEYVNAPKAYYNIDQYLPGIFLAMASSVVGWYFILVIVRYVMKYFSRPKNNDGGYGKPEEYPRSPEIRLQASGEHHRASPAQARHVVVEVPPVPGQAAVVPVEACVAPPEVPPIPVDEPPAPVPVVKKYVAGTLPDVASASILDRETVDVVNVVEKQATTRPSGSQPPLLFWICVSLVASALVTYSLMQPTASDALTGSPSFLAGQSRSGEDSQIVNRAFVVTIDDRLGDRHPSLFLDVSANSGFRDWFVGSRYRGVENLKLEGLMGASAFFVNSAGDPIEISVLQFGTEDLAELVLAAGDRNGIFVDQMLEPRSWMDASGKFNRKASFAGRSGNAVFLVYQSPAPSLGVVPFDLLSKADQAYVNSQILAISAGPRAE